MIELAKKQAYIDDELSAEERREFEATLSDAERNDLMRDKEFCHELYRRLKGGPDCPCGLWSELKTKMEEDCCASRQEDIPTSSPVPRKFHWRIVAVAAAVLFNAALLGVILNNRKPEETTFTMGPGFAFYADTQKFASLACERCDHNGLCCSLRDHGFGDLLVAAPTKASHPLKTLGITYRKVAEQEYAQIFFDCCGKPMLAVVSPKDKPIDLRNAHWEKLQDFHMSSKMIGNYRITVAGPHADDGVLSLFSAKSKG